MATISSLGIGSGLDLSSIVSGLVDAERVPTESRLAFKEESATTELSAFGALKSSISLFQGTLSDVQSPATYNVKNATLSDDSVFSASVTSIADVGSYSVEVTDLAKNHSLATSAANAFNDINDSIGTGTLTLRFGETTADPYSFTQDTTKATHVINVNATNGNTTLSGMRDYINENDFGVRASIINDGTGYRLTLTSVDSGANNSMEITVTGDADANNIDDSGLSRLAFNASAQTSMLQTVVAQDAALSINGLAITRETNTVQGAINGVTLNLMQADVGNIVNVTVSEDDSSIYSSIEEFVAGYNGLTETINALTRYDASTQEAGILIGDSTVRSISSQLRNIMTSSVSQLSGNLQSLADIGLKTQGNGTLEIDTNKLSNAIENYPSEIESLFRPQGRATNDGVSLVTSTTESQPGNYSVFVNSLATQGVYNGSTLNSLVINNNNDEFSISVDGVSSNAILLTQATYADGDALATHLQAQINGDAALRAAGALVEVIYDSVNNELDISSSKYGSDSVVEFTSVDTSMLNDLGFNVGTNGAAGLDIDGTINGLNASGEGRTLTSTTGESNGISLLIDSGTTGSQGQVSFSNGIISSINELLSRYVDSDGIISTREEGLNSELEEISEEREKLDLRISNLEARLIAQFSALDSLIAQFNNTSSFLTQQLANLPEPNSINNNN